MGYALIFFLFAALFGWAGDALYAGTPLSGLVAFGFGYAALAEIITGSLYLSSSLLRVNPGPLFKRPSGRLRRWPRFFVWPYLIFEYRVWRSFRARSREPIFERVRDDLFLGSLPTAADLPALERAGVSAVLDLVAEMEGPAALRAEGRRYLALPTLDGASPSLRDFGRGVEFVAACREEGRKTLIHCTFGHGRSAAMMAAVLIARGEVADPEPALRELRGLQRLIYLTREQRRTLERFSAGWRRERRLPPG